MTYKTNYEIHARSNLETEAESDFPSKAYFSPLAHLYPHVFALQLQTDPAAWSHAAIHGFPAYSEEMYSAVMEEGEPASINARFVTKLRRILRRDSSSSAASSFSSSSSSRSRSSCCCRSRTEFRSRHNSTASSP